MIARIRGWFRKRLASWVRARQGTDELPVTLSYRRIYILPMKQGYAFAAVVFALLLGSMNYTSSLGFAATFLMAGIGIVAMHHCHNMLLRLKVVSARAAPVFAGQDAVFRVTLSNTTRRTKADIELASAGAADSCTDLVSGEKKELVFKVPTKRRGRLRIERFQVSSTYPLALFRAWSWLHPAVECLVYPAPAPAGLATPARPDNTGDGYQNIDGNDDFSGLRGFRPGDSPRHVAWKPYAREQGLLVKQFSGGGVVTRWFHWESTPGNDTEQRLSQLCRWILDADARNEAYGLTLPSRTFQPDLGPNHRDACLAALALYEPNDDVFSYDEAA